MRIGTRSADGKFRSNFLVAFRVGTEEIVGCVEYAFSHGGMGYEGDDLHLAIREVLTFDTKAEIEEAVKKVLTEEGESYDSKNWDNELSNTARESLEQIVFDRFKREYDL